MKNRIVILMLGLCLSTSIIGCANTNEEVSSLGGALKTTASSSEISTSTEESYTDESNIIEVEESSTIEVEESSTTENDSEVQYLEPGEKHTASDNIPEDTDALLSPTVNTTIYTDNAKSQDKSGEHDFNSSSSEDAYNYLEDDMTLEYELLGKQGETGVHEYTQRFLYPEILPNEFYDKVEVTHRTDKSMQAYTYTGDERLHVIDIEPGHDGYHFKVDTFGKPNEYTVLEELGTVISDGKEVTVYRDIKYYEDKVDYSIYTYTLGAFTVEIQYNTDKLYTLDEFQRIVDTIQLQ